MKNMLLTIPMVMSCLVPTMTQAYTLTIQSDLNLNQIDSKYTAALVTCSAYQFNTHSDSAFQLSEHPDSGQSYAPLIAGSIDGGVDVKIDATKPLLEYEGIKCTVQLCGTEGDSGSCSNPNTPDDYNETLPHRTRHAQPLSDSLIMVIPPPSYQVSGGKQSSTSANQSAKNSGNKGKGTGKKTIGSVAGDANTVQGYGETLLAAAKVGVAIYRKDVPALSAALGDLTMNGTGVATNAAFGAADSDAIGIVGDMAGLGLGFASAAASAAAGGAALTVGGALLPLTATLTGSMALGDKINKALDKKFDYPIQRAMDAIARDKEVEPEGYKEAVAASEARRAAQAADAQRVAEDAFRAGDPSDQQPEQSDDTSSRDNTEDRSPTSGHGPQPTANAEEQQENTPSGAGSASGQVASGSGQERGGQGNSFIGVIIESHTNSDGSYGYTTMVYEKTEDGGTRYVDTIETTCAGGFCVSDYGNRESEVHNDEAGGAPENGTVAPFSVGSGDGESDDPGDGSSDESSNGNESGDGSSSNDGCNQGDSNCNSDDDEAPAEDEEATTDDTETSDNSTPNPNESDDRSKGLAWAMQNPDNPLAQQILKDAATAIIENSAYCQLGCSEAEAKGGLLWAMLNPGNPLAQSILANTAQAVADHSGSGQTGGVGDNPAYESNEGVSDQDLMRIELIIAGGGVVDPPESSGSGSAPDSPLTGGVGPVPSGPINSNNLEFHQLQGGARLDDGGPDDPTDPEDVQLRLNNSGRIQ